MTVVVLLTGTGAVFLNHRSGLSFVDVSAEAFTQDRNLNDEACYRYSLMQDSIKRPRSTSRDVVQPMSFNASGISGDFTNLPISFTAPELQQCIWTIGSPSIAVGDVNGDGNPDIVRAPDQVWLNKGDATFKLETLPVETLGTLDVDGPLKGLPSFISRSGNPLLVDLDNDGQAEVLSTVRNYSSRKLFDVYRRTDSGWTKVTEKFPFSLPNETAVYVNTAAALDFDRDGWVDIALGWAQLYQVHYQNSTDGFPNVGMVLLRNLQGHGFTDVTEQTGITQAVRDVVIDNVYTGTQGRFWEPFSAPHTITAADMDNDGWSDLVIAGDYGTGMLLYNQTGKGFATDSAVDLHGYALMGPALTDDNGDGYLDLFITQIHPSPVYTWVCKGGRPCSNDAEKGNIWMISEGNHQYRDHASAAGLLDGSWGWGATFADLDNDGKPELAQAAGYGYSLSPSMFGWTNRHDSPHLWSREGKKWVDVTKRLGLNFGQPTAAVAAADFDKDGRLDLVFTEHGSTRPRLFLNRTGNTGNWFSVDLEHYKGKSEAQIRNARVEITYAGGKQWSQAGLQNFSYNSSGVNSLWFGVGDAEKVTVRITWPDGTESTWENLRVNRSWMPED